MSVNLTLRESDAFAAIGNALTAFVLAGTSVIRGQQNRVPEPVGADFCVMWPLSRVRLSQNVDTYNDIAFIGSISGNTLTVTQMLEGTIVNGLVIDAADILANTSIVAQLTGNPVGGVGTYKVNNPQSLLSTTMQAGSKNILQSIQFTVQIDVHGPMSADNAHIISTIFRDAVGVDKFTASGFDIASLYCNDPRQMPFIDGEQQQEERWIVEAVLQVNPVISMPQDFASNVVVPIQVVL